MNAEGEERRTNTQLVGGAKEEGEGVGVAEHLAEGEVLQRDKRDGNEGLRVIASRKNDGECVID